MAEAPNVDVFSAHAVEGVFLAFQRRHHRVADEVLNTALVLQPRVIASFAPTPFAGTARPSGLGYASLQFPIATVHVDRPHIEVHGQREHVDERQDVGFLVDHRDVVKTLVQSASNGVDQGCLQGFTAARTEPLPQFIFAFGLVLGESGAELQSVEFVRLDSVKDDVREQFHLLKQILTERAQRHVVTRRSQVGIAIQHSLAHFFASRFHGLAVVHFPAHAAQTGIAGANAHQVLVAGR